MNIRTGVTMLIIVAMLIAVSTANKYCNVKTCGNSHTACIYWESGPSERCTGYQGSGVTESEKRKLVDLHNKLRQNVACGNETRGSPGGQPRAKYMPNLVWDDELAFVAQRWADQCTWKHDSCRNVDRFRVGQNLAYISTVGDVNTIKVETMVQMWYDEVKDFSKHQVPRFTNQSPNNRMIGHYTQLVWAKSNKIGCGIVKYKELFFNKKYLVCNYGPAGNYMDRPVYEIDY